MTPPVLLLVFNRPDHTAQVMEQIRRAEPPKLFVGADGPRPSCQKDVDRCKEAREVATDVDWDCEVHTLFRDQNLGCGAAVNSSISWFFDHVDEGIILEDDCVPDLTFFSFCEHLLKKYRGDTRVSMVSGQNPLGTWKENEQSYHFSKYGGIWGWATWGAMWELHDIKDSDYKRVEEVMQNELTDNLQVRLRTKGIRKAISGEIDTWDYQWFYTRLLHHTISVVPAKNLVRNIGFGELSTHTSEPYGRKEAQKNYSMSFPLRSPRGLYPDLGYDKEWFNQVRGFSGHKTIRYFRKQVILLKDYLGIT